MNRQDIFGFYRVGGLKMYSQIEAVEISQRLNFPITWHFNDEVYSSFDWTKEPGESISELYKKRCEQLREKYDYLVLFYSGGSDSDNILNFFVENNIILDEVASLIDYQATENKLSLWNAEIFEVAVPKIKKIQEKQPHLIHTLIDVTPLVMETYSSFNLEQLYNQNTSFATFTSYKDKIKMSQDHWKKMFSTGKKVGFIHGIEKPRVEIGKKFKFSFSFACASIAAAVSPSMQRRNSAWEFDELFYWSPDCPKIPIKQAHIIKKFIKNYGLEKFKKHSKKVGEAIRQPPAGSFVLVHGENFLQNEDLSRLIYPYWYNIPYQFKATNLIFYDKESWFTEKMNSEEQAKNWKTITKKVLDLTETDYIKQSFFNHALHISKPYNLGN